MLQKLVRNQTPTAHHSYILLAMEAIIDALMELMPMLCSVRLSRCMWYVMLLQTVTSTRCSCLPDLSASWRLYSQLYFLLLLSTGTVDRATYRRAPEPPSSSRDSSATESTSPIPCVRRLQPAAKSSGWPPQCHGTWLSHLGPVCDGIWVLCHDVIGMTASEDVRNCNINGEPLKTANALDV